MPITEARLRETFTGTGALLVLSLIPAGVLAAEAARGEYVSPFIVFPLAYIFSMVVGWLAMLPGLITVPLAKRFSIESKAAGVIISIVYFILYFFCTGMMIQLLLVLIFDTGTMKQLGFIVGIVTLVSSCIQCRKMYDNLL